MFIKIMSTLFPNEYFSDHDEVQCRGTFLYSVLACIYVCGYVPVWHSIYILTVVTCHYYHIFYVIYYCLQDTPYILKSFNLPLPLAAFSGFSPTLLLYTDDLEVKEII